MAMMTGRRIINSDAPAFRSPSGLPTRHLVDAATGSRDLFVAEQWLQPGDRVLRHVHPRDEVLLFLSGSGAADVGDSRMPISAGVTLFVPAGAEHEFRNTGEAPLHVIVIFPGGSFAETTLLDPRPALAPSDGVA